MKTIYSLLENNENYMILIKELTKKEYSGIISSLS